MKLAIVDDNPEELQKLYTTCAAFLSACTQIAYSFVIFDIYLQDATGIDMATAFREIAPRTPIIFLTSSPEHRADAFRVHAFDYLEKPVSTDMITRLFDELAITQEKSTDTQTFVISIDRKQLRRKRVQTKRKIYFHKGKEKRNRSDLNSGHRRETSRFLEFLYRAT